MQKITALSLAFVTASLSLVFAGGEATVAPFGWSAVIVVYVLATLPLAVVAAHGASAMWPVLRHRGVVLLLVPLGLLLGWLTLYYGGSLRLRQEEVSSLVRMAIRVLWPLALQLPWALLALGHGREMIGDQPERSELNSLRALGLSTAAVAIAAVLPSVYLDDVARRHIDEVNAAIAQGRLARAVDLLKPICQVGASQPRVFVAEGRSRVSPFEAQQYWKERIDELQQELERLRRGESTPAVQYSIALAQRALGDVAGARRDLADLAESDSAAALLMAQTYYDEQDWGEAQRRYRQAAELAKAQEQPANLRTAYDALAAVAGQQRRFGEAEEIYRQAIEQLPEEEAHFHFRLGRHYQLVGRPIEARRQWEEAARLDPEQFQKPVEAAIAGELNSPTPGCLLGPLRSQP